MKIYVAGPMTGLPDFNYPAFHAAAAALRAVGHQVENPAENPDPACKSWAGYMRMALAQLVTCDAIYLLKGWERSKGANIECDLAFVLGLEIQFALDAECSQEYVSGMNWPLPCDVTMGHGTICKGVPLRVLVARGAQALSPIDPDMTDVVGCNARLHFRRGWLRAEVAHGARAAA